MKKSRKLKGSAGKQGDIREKSENPSFEAQIQAQLDITDITQRPEEEAEKQWSSRNNLLCRITRESILEEVKPCYD